MKANEHKELLSALKARFEKNMNRHKGLEWATVQAKLVVSLVRRHGQRVSFCGIWCLGGA